MGTIQHTTRGRHVYGRETTNVCRHETRRTCRHEITQVCRHETTDVSRHETIYDLRFTIYVVDPAIYRTVITHKYTLE